MDKKSNGVIIDGFDEPYVPPVAARPVIIDSGEPTVIDGSAPRVSGIETGLPTTPETTKGPDRSGFDIFEPASFNYSAPTSDGNGRKRRGRPSGSKNAPKSEIAQVSPNLSMLESLEAILLSIHFAGAKLLSVPEMELDEAEARKLSDSIKNVAKHYTTTFDPKKLALIQLGAVCVGIYGPRIVTVLKSNSSKTRTEPVDISTRKTEPPKPGDQPIKAVPTRPTNPSQMWDAAPIDSVE